MKKIVVLDRDGVINQDSDDYIKCSEEWLPIEGSIEAIAKLKKSGYKVAIATNQSGIARRFFGYEHLNGMHEKLASLLEDYDAAIDHISICPHLPEDNCNCRKPRTGMLDEIQAQFNASLTGCWFIGDSLKDLLAAEAREMTPVLVKTGKGNITLEDGHLPQGTKVFDNLAEAVDCLISDTARMSV